MSSNILPYTSLEGRIIYDIERESVFVMIDYRSDNTEYLVIKGSRGYLKFLYQG